MQLKKYFSFPVLGLILLSFNGMADVGGYPSFASCLDQSNGKVDSTKICSTSKSAEKSARIYYNGQNISASTVTTVMVSNGSGNTIIQHVQVKLTLTDPSDFYHQLGQMVTLARFHVCETSSCANTSRTNDVQIALTRDSGQKSLTGTAELDLVFNSGSSSAEVVQSIEPLIGGVFEPLIINL